MADINGITFIWGKGISHFATKNIMGLWFDKNDYYTVPPKEREGWGVLFKINLGRIVRPVPRFWNKHFWIDKIPIRDIPTEEWNDYFGKDLAEKIRELDPYCYKYPTYNPWFAKRWFILRLPKWIPSCFISIGTPWKSIYIGCKDYEVDVPDLPGTQSSGKDRTWTNKNDKKIAQENEPRDVYYALCPSLTFRKSR